MHVTAGPTPRAGRREWIGLGVLALPCVLYSMDLTVLNLAVPSLSAELRPTAAQLLWIVDVYGFVLAGFLIPMGALGDRIGRRRLLLCGAAAFGAASVLAAFATSAAMLIAARAVLGVAGATLAPSTLSLIRSMFADEEQRAFAIGVWITSYSVGGVVGPLVGGLMLAHFPWGSVFLVGVPVMLLLLAVGPRLLPEFRDPAPGPVDVASAALSLAAVLLVVYGLKQAAQGELAGSEAAWRVVAPLLGGAALGALFVRRQGAAVAPFVDPALFRRPVFVIALAAYTLGTFVAFGAFFFAAQYLQLVIGLSPMRAGVYTLPTFLAFIAGSLIAPRLVRRVGPAALIAAGLCLTALGLLVFALAGRGAGAAALVAGGTIYSLGLAPVFTLATDLIVGAAPPERAGAAAALSETASELGGALGIAMLGSLGTAVYRSGMTGVSLDGLSPALREAARGTLAGALGLADRLPVHAGAALVGAARGAFSHSLGVVASVSAALALATAVAVLMVMRRPAPPLA